MEIDVANRRIADVQVAGMVVEFPRFNDMRDALATRFVYLPTLTDTLRLSNPPSATFNTMMKVNTESGSIVRHDFGNRWPARLRSFRVARTGRRMTGTLAIFAFDPVNRISDLVLLDAAHIDTEPVAVIRMPQRIPQGLHGTWIPKV